jgi:4-phospho-D-threonate 3-dehydrogenase / 4-phospho-D-erythronate 3-dehydrogenase
MKPILAITMGDPTGVGPETIMGAWSGGVLAERARAVVIGHPAIMRRAAELVGCRARVVEVTGVDQVESSADTLPCLRCCGDEVVHLAPARVDPRGGHAAFQAVTVACQLAREGSVDALVTAPLNKTALAAAGHDYPGHTELLADLCGVQDVAMMLYLAPGPRVRGRAGLGVAHATLHVPLRDIFGLLTSERILQTARLAQVVTRALLESRRAASPPRIGVCAVNPHAGEGMLFGDEEFRVIRPAVEQGCAAGLDLHGPFPADTLLARAADGEFDAVVAMYHDQGHIALKLIGMHQAVNITLGLPVIRTSVAHGTAYDRAWKGAARPDSMIEAVRVAVDLVRCQHRLEWH